MNKNYYSKLKEVLDQLKPLHVIIESWEKSGQNLQDSLDLQKREQLMGVCSLSKLCISWLLHKMQTLGISALHTRIIVHDYSLTALEKQALLPNFTVQKTVSVKIGDSLILCSGLDDFKLSKNVMTKLGSKLGISSGKAKRYSINPLSFPPETNLGLLTGMVSSFLPPNRLLDLSMMVYLYNSNAEDKTTDVVVSISPFESLTVPKNIFRTLVQDYAAYAYPDITYFEVDLSESDILRSTDPD